MSLIDRAWNAFSRRDDNAAIDEELQFHVDQRTRDNIADGMDPEAARRDALQRFGSRAAVREETRAADVLVTLETLVQDLAYAVRSLVRQPMFTIIAVATLAIGIGANTAIFTVVYNVLLRPLPFPQPDQLVVVSYQSRSAPFWLYPGLVDSDYLALRDADLPFAATATFTSAPLTLTGAGDATRLQSAKVTPDFFRVLGVNAAIGRTLTAEDVQSGREPVVIVGDALWRARFAADPALVGRRIALDGVDHTVAGILPPAFTYPSDSQVWTPLVVHANPRVSFSRPAIARLQSGTPIGEARAAWATYAGQLRSGSAAGDWDARVIPLKDAVVRDVRTPLLIFSGAVVLVLVIACVNVSNLLLMRTLSRRQELATRLALGAGRARIVRQLLTETAVLALAGGLAAAVVTLWSVPALLALFPAGRLPRLSEVHIDAGVLVFPFALALVSGLVLGVLPALHGTRAAARGGWRGSTSWSTRRADLLRHTLVVAEVALALVLLVGAGLLVRSFLRLTSVDPGFQASQVMTMTVNLPEATYSTVPALHAFHDRLIGSLSALQGVVSAGLVNWMPLGDMRLGGDVMLGNGNAPPPAYRVLKTGISPGYLTAMGIRLVRGRDFADRDNASGPGAVIVSESVAETLWPGEDALGQQLSIESRPTSADWLTVIGIVEEVRQEGYKDAFAPAIYQPYWQVKRPMFLSHVTFVVRTSDDPSQIAPAMRAALAQADPNVAAQSMVSMEDRLASTVAEPRFQTRLLVVFSALALVLAAIGVYGVLAASVNERRREIGIRIALGAERPALVRMVLQRVLVLAVCGVVLGAAGALALSGFLTQLLFEIKPTDAETFAGAAALLVGVALVAGLIPAKRASAVDPVGVLRAE